MTRTLRPAGWRAAWTTLLALSAVAAAAGLSACDRPGGGKEAPTANEYGPAQPVQQAATPQPAQDATRVLVCLGDSITAGFGLREDQSYPHLLQERLQSMGLKWRVVNAGVSGDTSAGGLARMDWLLKQRIDVLFVALGGNDGLRGLGPEQMQTNLSAIVEKAQAAGAKVVLAGMRMPTNYGADYRKAFEAVYPAAAKQHGIPLLPFLLEGVALNPKLNQQDGIHPTADGAKIVEANVWNVLAPLIEGK